MDAGAASAGPAAPPAVASAGNGAGDGSGAAAATDTAGSSGGSRAWEPRAAGSVELADARRLRALLRRQLGAVQQENDALAAQLARLDATLLERRGGQPEPNE